jgi:hypothetical protein
MIWRGDDIRRGPSGRLYAEQGNGMSLTIAPGNQVFPAC